MRVFPIAQLADEGGAHDAGGGKGVTLIDSGEPLADRRVIGGGQRIGLGGEGAALLQGSLAPGHSGVIRGVGDDSDMGVVLGSGAHHAGAADVDILDDLVAGATLGDRLHEGVEVHHHQIDRADVMLGHGGQMLGIIAHGQQAAVHLGMQGFHPAVHHLGKAGEIGNVAHRKARIAQGLCRTTGGDQIHTLCRQRPAQLDKACLVGNRKQGAADGDGHGHGGSLA